jgi:hypothetical protein
MAVVTFLKRMNSGEKKKARSRRQQSADYRIRLPGDIQDLG